MRPRSPRSLVAWALVGLIAGHQATYLAVYHDPALVTQVLASTGHGWLWLAPIFVLSAALTALVVGLQGGEAVRSTRWRFAFLAGIQATTFVVLELAERYASGSDAGHLVASLLSGTGGLVLVVGIAVQTVVAAALALASRVVDRVAAALAGRRRAASHPARVRRVLRPDLVIRPRLLEPGRAAGPRAPPLLA